MSSEIRWIDGGVCSPVGFKAAGVSAGIKVSGNPDVAVLVSDLPAAGAGMLTSSAFPAAPILFCRSLLQAGGPFRGVVVNSGNANSCTGGGGLDDAKAMAAEASRVLGGGAVFPASTGRIGVRLPMDKIFSGIAAAAAALSSDASHAFARAIMTTDTKMKSAAVEFQIAGRTVRIGGACKGVGMIAPKLIPHATMLAFLTTDAGLPEPLLAKCLAAACRRTFNCVTVDGDTSTNDAAILLANGASGVHIDTHGLAFEIFQKALDALCEHLAKSMARDGEGATKLVTIDVRGASSDSDAEAACRAVANSMLCKTAWFGGDPNWGRVVAAVGYSGAKVDPARASVAYNGIPVFKDGAPASPDKDLLNAEMRKSDLHVDIDLAIGSGVCRFWTCDISYEYVKINAEYFT